MDVRAKLVIVAAAAAMIVGAPFLAEANAPPKPATPSTAAAPTTGTAPRAPTTTGSTPVAPTTAPKATTPTAAAPAAAAAQTQTLSRSDFELVVTLVRNTLVALHQANVTGNYTVLRDLGSPGFRDANSATRLGEIFAPIRARGVDLSRVVMVEPSLTVAKINDNGMLNIAGSLAVQPVPVNFEMLYQGVSNSWQLFGISINAEAPTASLAAPQAAPTPAAAAPTATPRPAVAPTPNTRP